MTDVLTSRQARAALDRRPAGARRRRHPGARDIHFPACVSRTAQHTTLLREL